MIRKFREYMAIRKIRKAIKHLSPDKQVQLIVHAFLQIEINEQVYKVLNEEITSFAKSQEKGK